MPNDRRKKSSSPRPLSEAKGKQSRAPRPLSETKGKKGVAAHQPKLVRPPRPAAAPSLQPEPELERLQKVLAEAGVASRRSSEQLILQRRVRVNGKVVNELGVKVDPARDVVSVDNKPLPLRDPHAAKLYIALHKPRGYITSADDEQGRETVLDLLGDVGGRVYPVGRLDNSSEGLLLLTNDGDLTFRLTHPRYKVDKEYEVQTEGVPDEASLQQLRNGVMLDEGVMSEPAQVELLHAENGRAWLRFIIHEGRKRQIRNMLTAVGYQTRRLMRVRIGPLQLGELKRGEHRPLTNGEVKALRHAVGLDKDGNPIESRPASTLPPPPSSRFVRQGGGATVHPPASGSRPRPPAPTSTGRPFPANRNPLVSNRPSRPPAPAGARPFPANGNPPPPKPRRSSSPASPAGSRPFPANGNPPPPKPRRSSSPTSPGSRPPAPSRSSRPVTPGSRPPAPSRSNRPASPQRSSSPPKRGKG